jgi:hypothetical protein
MNYYYLPYLAAAYGAGNYNTQTYSCTTQQQQAGSCTTSSSTTSNTTLVNTGIAVATFVTFACLIIFVALVARVWKRKIKPTIPS